MYTSKPPEKCRLFICSLLLDVFDPAITDKYLDYFGKNVKGTTEKEWK